ncbi:GntR family transcriptional regulator [Actinomadura sp. SCN-SB]|uniref:GntR family transcriptional regulator n=1 Tax=Actinomadura sp. SCN-SB TaxID=3373092 RepID=UPI0037534F22
MSSGEQVRLYVRRLVFDGVLRQGQRVPQDAVAEALGVSRIPVREALIALEREGWVTIVPHRGAFVNALDELSVRDQYELYGMFYGFGVRRAVERRGAAVAERLAPIQKRLSTERDPAELHRLTLEFHKTVIDAAGSPRLGSLLRQMSDIVPGNFFEMVPGAAEVAREGTAAIVTAIQRDYGELAEKEYATMMRRLGDLVVERFRERGMFDPIPEERPS